MLPLRNGVHCELPCLYREAELTPLIRDMACVHFVQWHSTFFLLVAPYVISLRLRTPQAIDVQFKLHPVYNLHLKQITPKIMH
jgi:hypothetical protein